MRRPRLAAVAADKGFRLVATFVDGRSYEIDLSQDVRSLRGLRPLQESTAFAGAVISEGGWSVEWPAHDIQIGADTLWLDAQEQNARSPGQRDFLRWRARNRLSLSAAAEALGVSVRTISAYGTGARPVPKMVLLACEGWEARHKHDAA